MVCERLELHIFFYQLPLAPRTSFAIIFMVTWMLYVYVLQVTLRDPLALHLSMVCHLPKELGITEKRNRLLLGQNCSLCAKIHHVPLGWRYVSHCSSSGIFITEERSKNAKAFDMKNQFFESTRCQGRQKKIEKKKKEKWSICWSLRDKSYFEVCRKFYSGRQDLNTLKWRIGWLSDGSFFLFFPFFPPVPPTS